jgi:hypothetical protein
MASTISRNFASVLLVSFGALASDYAAANGAAKESSAQSTVRQAPAAIAVLGDLPKPPSGATELKFREFFKMPVGPRGLDPSEKLAALAGKRVRLVGYMVQQEKPASEFFVLTPLPLSLGDEDESLSDDLPASTVFVHFVNSTSAKAIPYFSGLLQLTGTLELGPHEESDGHVSTVRLQLDPELAQIMRSEPEASTAAR